MRRLALAVLAWFVFSSLVVHADPLNARHKPGPVSLHGNATHVSSHSFVLSTLQHGSYHVLLFSATRVVLRNTKQAAHLRNGERVSVRGLLRGTQMRAMTVHVFPAALKDHTVRGTVTAQSGEHISVSTSGGLVHIVINSHTVLQGASNVHVGDHVRARLPAGSSDAVLIYVYAHHVVGQRLHLTGTVLSYGGGTLVVASHGRTYRVLVSQQTSLHVGATSATTKVLRRGAQITVYACCVPGTLQASSVHVRVSPARAAKHVRLRGTVVRRSASTLTIHTSSLTTTVGVDAHTLWYGGVSAGSTHGAPTGSTVTVFACCAGMRLVAVSVHVLHSLVRAQTTILHGQIRVITPASLQLAGSQGTPVVHVDAHTRYQVGGSISTRTQIRVGDVVSVRAVRQGRQWKAVTVHVESVSRTMHTVHGVVVHVGTSSLSIDAKGMKLTFLIASGTPILIDGRASSPSGLRSGDRVAVRVQGPIRSPLTALRIISRRPVVKPLRIRGTVLAARSSEMVVRRDRGGQQLKVQVAGTVRPLWNGGPVSFEFMFPGVQVEVTGAMVRGVLVARSLVLHLKPAHASGAIIAVAPARLTVARRSGAVTSVLLPHLVSITDAGKHMHATDLRTDMTVKISGYRAANKMLFADRIQITHPHVSVSGHVSAVSPALTMQTSGGTQYHLRFNSSSTIVTNRPEIVFRPQDLPSGCRVHVDGRALTRTVVLVSRLDVHLRSERLRGRTVSVTAGSITIATDAGTITIKILSSTAITQGSRAVKLSDLVAGDDVTVGGYALAASRLIAIHVDVHRRRVGIDGTITLVSGQDVTVSTAVASTSEHVLLSPATVIIGGSGPLTSGLRIHVSGYRRGDGVILAIQIRLRTKRVTATPHPNGYEVRATYFAPAQL